VQDTGADIARAAAALGFAPATDLETGLRAEFDWVRSRRTSGRSAIATVG
jgi:nucleoside-diphosphate-sugar epimerase